MESLQRMLLFLTKEFFIMTLDGNIYHYKNSCVIIGKIIQQEKKHCLYSSILGRGNLIVLSVMKINSQVNDFLQIEMSYLYFLKMCEEKIVKPMLKIHRQEYHTSCSCHCSNVSNRSSFCNETLYLSTNNDSIKSNLTHTTSDISYNVANQSINRSLNTSYNSNLLNESSSIYSTPPTNRKFIDMDNLSIASSSNLSNTSDKSALNLPCGKNLNTQQNYAKSSTPIQIKIRSGSLSSVQNQNLNIRHLNISPIISPAVRRRNSSSSTPSLNRTIPLSQSKKKDPLCMKQVAEEALLKALLDVAEVVRTELIGAFDKTDPYLPKLWQLKELKSVHQTYNKLLCDVISLGPIPIEGEKLQDIFEHARLHLNNLVPGMCMKSDNVFLEYIMNQPINHIKEYEKLLSCLRNTSTEAPANAKEEIRLEYELWKKCQKEIKIENVQAQSTHTFWSKHPKLSQRLISPGRFIIMNSEVQPIKLLESNNTTNNSFYLMTDVFVHMQKSFSQIYDLRTTWVEMENSDSGKVITLILPEERMKFVCKASNEYLWFKSLKDAINSCSQSLDEASETVFQASLSANKVKRTAQHIFTKYEKFKDAIYDGLWYQGCPHGEGEMRWSSGQRYMGYFKHGDYHGPGIMQYMTPTGIVNFEAIWTNGKAVGHCIIRYPNGSTYSGTIIDSVRNGHGRLESKNSIYNGNWVDDRKHGYGILLEGQEKYLGQWHEDIRHGLGIFIMRNGICCLANFHHGQIQE
ncbi:unnamed protein product, partial [Meganyctiphanes norvegica]